MATTMNNNFHEYDPRQRLTGAIVLFLLAVILLPMLLSHNNDNADVEDDPVVMEITNEGKKVFVSRISALAPQGDKTVDSADNAEKNNSEPEKQTTTKVAESSEPKPAATDKATTATQLAARRKELEKKSAVEKTAPSTPTAESTKAVIPAGSWILQIGVFSQPENASKKVAELKKKGFDATSGKVKTSKGVVTKVWIGPYKDREAAKRMQDRLQHKTRERGYVVQHNP